MTAPGQPTRKTIRQILRDAPAVALIAGALLGPPPGLDPPPGGRPEER